MEVPTGRRDGAAFDPADGTWRTIAPSPAPIFEAPTAWSGKRLVVLTSKATLAYDPVADAWETWEPPPDIEVNQIVPTDKGLLFVGYSSRGPDSADWLLAEGAWQALPRDPFGESYDRSVAWDGDRYWLLSMAVEHHFEASNGTSSRVAVLSDGGWQAVSDSTPDLGYGQRWWIVGDRLVAPPRGAGKAAYFDLGSHTWTSAPVEEDRECALPAVGAGAGWVGGGGSLLLAASTKEILRVPPCPALARPDLAVWADDELLVWGGVSSDSENQAVGLRWRPPAP
ncbi:MAG TPA: hypothetical protein VLI04_22695 [Nocardioidaceae bacterium]|nr:hypothetical protein [Nocardioidaceae bacterium]